MAEKHPGFAAVQDKIAKKSGVSKERAGAILAASTRHASAGAKKANPRLKRVAGGSTMLAPSHPKAKALVQGRKSNMARDEAFTSGSQRRENLAMKKDSQHGCMMGEE